MGSCTECGITASGIPGFIVIQRELREFKEHYNSTCAGYENKLAVLGETLDVKLSDLPGQVADIFHERYVVDGVAPLGQEDIRKVFIELLNAPDGTLSGIRDCMKELMTKQDDLSRAVQATNTGIVPQPAATNNWEWLGRTNSLPENFSFPSLDTKTMWGLWFFGKRAGHVPIGPLKNIWPKKDLRRRVDKTNFSRTKAVMEKLVSIACRGHNPLIKSERDIVVGNTDVVFDYSFPILIEEIYRGHNVPVRAISNNVKTLAKMLMKLPHQNH